MRRMHIVGLLLLMSIPMGEAAAQLIPVLGAQRAGTSTAQFLKIGVGARAAAMGETFIAVANDASALYWNPAGIAQFNGHEAVLSHTQWLVDVRHQFLGAVYRLSPEDAIGLSITSLHTDDMPVTTEVHPTGNGTYFRFSDLAIGVTYGKKLTPQFSFGATVRYFEETLDMLKMRGVVVDLGTYYWTGLGSSRFSAVVSNFGNQVAPEGTAQLYGGGEVTQFQEFSPPTLFKFGFAFEPIQNEYNILTASVQLNHPNDNSENVSLGFEYVWSKTFAVRGGYRLNADEQSYSLGAGVATGLEILSLSLDYGFTAFGRLGGVHRISMLVRL